MTSSKIFSGVLLCVAAGSVSAAEVTALSGLDYSLGSYGNAVKTSITAVPLIAKYSDGPLVLKVSTAMIQMTSPGGVIAGGDGNFAIGSTNTNKRTVSGFGDLIVGSSYTVHEGNGWLVDITGKIKLPTGEKDKGLSTGKTDYTALVDVYKSIQKVTVNVGGGYKWVGDPAGVNFRNVYLWNGGVSTNLSDAVRVGMSLDYAQSVVTGLKPRQELMAYMLRQLEGGWKLQVYGSAGLNNNSPDVGAGVVLGYNY